MERTTPHWKVLRTPEDRFKDLPGFPFPPRSAEIEGLRIGYVDAGAGDPVLCLHGVLEWSYSYRKMIPLLAARNRVVVPDLPGFGRSDKFVDRKDHTLDLHARVVSGFIENLGLGRITLVANDWGAVVGLRVATQRPDLFDRLVVLNTALPTGDRPMNFTFTLWRKFVELAPDLPVGMVFRMGLSHGHRITAAEVAAYEAPFPDASFKAAAVELPLSLPMKRDDPGAAEVRSIQEALAQWNKPALVMFSDEDMLFSKEYEFFRKLIPTAADQPEGVIRGAGHFLHEERGEELAVRIRDFIGRTPSKA